MLTLSSFSALLDIKIHYHFFCNRVTLAGKDITLFHFLLLQPPIYIHFHLTFQQPGFAGTANAAFAGERQVGALF